MSLRSTGQFNAELNRGQSREYCKDNGSGYSPPSSYMIETGESEVIYFLVDPMGGKG